MTRFRRFMSRVELVRTRRQQTFRVIRTEVLLGYQISIVFFHPKYYNRYRTATESLRTRKSSRTARRIRRAWTEINSSSISSNSSTTICINRRSCTPLDIFSEPRCIITLTVSTMIESKVSEKNTNTNIYCPRDTNVLCTFFFFCSVDFWISNITTNRKLFYTECNEKYVGVCFNSLSETVFRRELFGLVGASYFSRGKNSVKQ